MERGGYVYIMTNSTKSTFYIGVTSNLSRRITEHQNGTGSEFTGRYNCKYLIYYEGFQSIIEAIGREKILKKWNRVWKENLIRKMNPEMKDLSYEVIENRL